jgi:cell division septation protein DedD
VNKGLATFLGATGRLMESAITPETDGSTPPTSTFIRTVPPASVIDDLARGRRSQFNPLPQPPLPRPLLPTETEIPLPQQTVFDLLTRPGSSTVVPSVGLVPETESLLTPEEEASFVDVEEEEPLVVEGVVEEGPTPELKEFLTPALPLTQTAASLSSGEAAEESPRTAAALAESERSVRGLTAKERAAQRFEVFRAQLRIMGRPTDDESVKDYIYELEQSEKP